MGVLGLPSLLRQDVIINLAVDQRFGWVWETPSGLKDLRGAEATVKFFNDDDTLICERAAEIYPLDAMILWAPPARSLTELQGRRIVAYRVDVSRGGGLVAVSSGYARIIEEG